MRSLQSTGLNLVGSTSVATMNLFVSLSSHLIPRVVMCCNKIFVLALSHIDERLPKWVVLLELAHPVVRKF